jgi:hypothetical protein
MIRLARKPSWCIFPQILVFSNRKGIATATIKKAFLARKNADSCARRLA